MTKPNFNWHDRTISPPAQDGSRYAEIQLRLHEINQERMRIFELPYELQLEKAALIEELYQIGQEKYEDFIRTGDRECRHLWGANTVSRQQTFRQCLKCGLMERVELIRVRETGGRGRMSDKPKVYLGVDIGIDGGIAIIKGSGDIHNAVPMPHLGTKGSGKRSYNINLIIGVIKGLAWADVRAVIEDATTNPKWSKHIWELQYGCLYTFMTLFEAEYIPYEIKKAKVWQKRVFEGMPRQDLKVMSALYCQRKYPTFPITVGKSTKPHTGITDALCIAEYCRLINLQEAGE